MAKRRKRNADRVMIHLEDQAPRIGCGRRPVEVVTYGRKWVTVIYDEIGGYPVRHKFKLDEWQKVVVQ